MSSGLRSENYAMEFEKEAAREVSREVRRHRSGDSTRGSPAAGRSHSDSPGVRRETGPDGRLSYIDDRPDIAMPRNYIHAIAFSSSFPSQQRRCYKQESS